MSSDLPIPKMVFDETRKVAQPVNDIPRKKGFKLTLVRNTPGGPGGLNWALQHGVHLCQPGDPLTDDVVLDKRGLRVVKNEDGEKFYGFGDTILAIITEEDDLHMRQMIAENHQAKHRASAIEGESVQTTTERITPAQAQRMAQANAAK